MEPTPYALRLAEPIGNALSTIHDSLNEITHFEPLTSKQRFTIGMTDIGELYFLPKLMEVRRKQAPGVNVSAVRNTAVNLQDEMEAGHSSRVGARTRSRAENRQMTFALRHTGPVWE